MNTIHSSSIAHYPVAYSKPRSERIDDSGASAVGAGKGTSAGQGSEVNGGPSSTEQIQAALAEAGVTNSYTSKQPNNTRIQQALNAYTQNNNQTIQRRLAEMISGIDTYA